MPVTFGNYNCRQSGVLIVAHQLGRQIKPLKPDNIGIIYAHSAKSEKNMLKSLQENLKQCKIPAIWLSDPDKEELIAESPSVM